MINVGTPPIAMLSFQSVTGKAVCEIDAFLEKLNDVEAEIRRGEKDAKEKQEKLSSYQKRRNRKTRVQIADARTRARSLSKALKCLDSYALIVTDQDGDPLCDMIDSLLMGDDSAHCVSIGREELEVFSAETGSLFKKLVERERGFLCVQVNLSRYAVDDVFEQSAETGTLYALDQDGKVMEKSAFYVAHGSQGCDDAVDRVLDLMIVWGEIKIGCEHPIAIDEKLACDVSVGSEQSVATKYSCRVKFPSRIYKRIVFQPRTKRRRTEQPS